MGWTRGIREDHRLVGQDPVHQILVAPDERRLFRRVRRQSDGNQSDYRRRQGSPAARGWGRVNWRHALVDLPSAASPLNLRRDERSAPRCPWRKTTGCPLLQGAELVAAHRAELSGGEGRDLCGSEVTHLCRTQCTDIGGRHRRYLRGGQARNLRGYEGRELGSG
jgi:hypothetical protein